MKLTPHTMIKAASGQVASELDNETIIMNAESGQYFGLDGVGQDIWKLIQNPISLNQICNEILSIYEVTKDECEQDVMSLVNELLVEEIAVIHTNT